MGKVGSPNRTFHFSLFTFHFSLSTFYFLLSTFHFLLFTPHSLLLLFGLCGFSGFEEFVDSILVDFDLALLFIPFAGGLDERAVGQVLTLAEDALANALALLREF